MLRPALYLACLFPGLLAAITATALAQAGPPPDDFEARTGHWSWQPLADPAPPELRDRAWVRDPLDGLILARLEQNGLRPAAAAAAEVWLRRVWFDLLGLPPSAGAVRAFLADSSAPARQRVVDELLASPHYGERWGRHWLDLVRYAESLGHEFDFVIPNAWRYRDYVVRALNADVPFDQFAREHIAGDLLEEPRIDPATGRNESVHGTASWWFAEQTHSPVDAMQHQADRIDNQLDTFSKAFLGTTIACARCHDHKFDAIRAADYYSLYGFIKSSRYVQQPVFATPAGAAVAARAGHRALADLAPAWRAPGPLADEPLPLRAGEALLADFSEPDDWFRTGDAFDPKPWRGPFVVGCAGPTLRMREFAAGWANSAALGRERDGVLHSPTFVIEDDYLHLELAGQDSRALVILEGVHLVRDPIYGGLCRQIKQPRPHWVTFDLRRWPSHRAHIQLLDQRAHDLADAHRDKKQYPADAWLAVRRVLSSSHSQPPRHRSAQRALDLWAATPPGLAAIEHYEATLAALPAPASVPGMADGNGEDQAVFVRGDPHILGLPTRRRFLEAISGAEPMVVHDSGRLQLAAALFSPANPLPARVLVNRAWHHLFGRGLVRTVDNLGHLGDRPTHPALLDRLARDLVQDGWSLKRLLRRLLLSATYAMSSRGSAAAARRDPDNDLFHRQNLRRLQGEALRDALLVFAGRLDPKLGGPSIALPLTKYHKARGKPSSGPVDDQGRRSIYLAVHRNFLSDMLMAFDMPAPFATVGRRNVSNVPAQALTLLNDPFVHAMTRLAAERAVTASARDPSGRRRIRDWFLAGFARPPSADESRACLQFLADERRIRGVGAEDPGPWADLAHALVNRKEFLFLP